MAREDPAPEPDDWAPEGPFDGFEVVRPLGRGGMGRVWLGRDALLDREVALKFIAAESPDRAARERFLLEARAIARLEHPNVVAIYRVGEAFGRPYLAYELVRGRSLDLVGMPLPWHRALEIGIGITRGLAAAHGRGVLHRDIKPGNVMLTESGHVKLLDFGLAKLVAETQAADGAAAHDAPSAPTSGGSLGAAAETDSLLERTLPAPSDALAIQGSLTATGTLLGTPIYMAPELWAGQPASPESDIYALGLVLWELCAGELPHRNLGRDDLARAVVMTDLPSLGSRVAGLPEAFVEVVDRCVRRRRADRFADAEAVRDALEAVLALYRPFLLDGETGAPAEIDPEAQLVASSFARVLKKGDFADTFYERLFSIDRSLRQLFPSDLTVQRAKLSGTLRVVVDNLKRRDKVIPLLVDLGRRHSTYGVLPDHLETVGKALVSTLAELDGESFTPETADAWRAAYGVISHAMQIGLAQGQTTVRSEVGAAPAVIDAFAKQGAAARPTEASEMAPPPVRWVTSGDATLAYSVAGDGPIDLVLLLGGITHLETLWQHPAPAALLRRLAAFSRIIAIDLRGSGLSERANGTIDDHLADVRCVLDDAGVERAAIFASGDAAPIAALVAATHPERIRSIVLSGVGGRDASELDALSDELRARWGEPLFVERTAPSLASDEGYKRWVATTLRLGGSPKTGEAMLRDRARYDLALLLSSLSVPALVIHRTEDAWIPAARARALAERVSSVTYLELPGRDHVPWAGDVRTLTDAVRRFVVMPPAATQARAFTTVVAVGADEADPVTVDRILQRSFAAHRAVELGGGRAAQFDAPVRALRCAKAIAGEAASLGLRVRIALTAGASPLEGSPDALLEDAMALLASAEPGEPRVAEALEPLVAGA